METTEPNSGGECMDPYNSSSLCPPSDVGNNSNIMVDVIRAFNRYEVTEVNSTL